MKRTIEQRVYGYGTDDQLLSYEPSVYYDFSTKDETRIIEVKAYDKTGSHKYVDVRITCDTFDACHREFSGQLTDGMFEDYYYGEIEDRGCSFSIDGIDDSACEKFLDIWDNVAVITREGSEYRVRAYDAYNNEILSKLYLSHKGARIAIGKLLSDAWKIK